MWNATKRPNNRSKEDNIKTHQCEADNQQEEKCMCVWEIRDTA